MPEKLMVLVQCFECGFICEYEIEKNEHGFYPGFEGYCPNDFLLLDQVIKEKT